MEPARHRGRQGPLPARVRERMPLLHPDVPVRDTTNGAGGSSSTGCSTMAGRRFATARTSRQQAGGGTNRGSKEDQQKLVQWLAKVRGPESVDAPYQTFPRPRGRATRAVVTEYEIPRELLGLHDVSGDSQGNIWFTSHKANYLGQARSAHGHRDRVHDASAYGRAGLPRLARQAARGVHAGNAPRPGRSEARRYGLGHRAVGRPRGEAESAAPAR